jgi:hypothetical protein
MCWKENLVNRAGDNIGFATRRASRFYWAWLVFATGMSILGNVTHALLVAPGDLRLLAAIASVVPPSFVLGSTHSLGLGLAMRRFAMAYTLGLVMTIGVAACAFLLSFDALRSLAVMLGWPSGTAWLFPIVIDVSIAQATFGLLSLSPLQARDPADMSTAHGQSATSSSAAVADDRRPRPASATSPNRHEAAIDDGSRPRRLTTYLSFAPCIAIDGGPGTVDPRRQCVDVESVESLADHEVSRSSIDAISGHCSAVATNDPIVADHVRRPPCLGYTPILRPETS